MTKVSLLDSIAELQLSDELVEMLKSTLGVSKVVDLLKTPCETIFGKIEEYFEEKSDQPKSELRSKVHNANLYFSDEFNGIGYVKIDDDTPIERLRLPLGIQSRIQIVRPHIKTLKDLVEADYQDLNRCLGVGKGRLEIMIAYLNKFGYHMKNEKNNMQEEKKAMRDKGEILLEDVGFRNYLLGKLNRYNVYTLRQLLDLGEEVYEIPGIGSKRAKDINYILGLLGLTIGDHYPEDGLTSTMVQISQLRTFNLKAKELINEKQKLMNEYEKLLQENEELQRISDALDDKILEYADQIREERAKKHG